MRILLNSAGRRCAAVGPSSRSVPSVAKTLDFATVIGVTQNQAIACCKILLHNGGMKREVAIARLKPFERRLREQGVSALYLFGSVASSGSCKGNQGVEVMRICCA